MKNSDFQSLKRGLAQAKAFKEGARRGYAVHVPVDVRAMRESQNLTRKAFADRYGLDHRTVEQWEQGRRAPDRSTSTYLRLIEREPDRVAELVGAAIHAG